MNKPIDLGALQNALEKARANATRDEQALSRAQIARDKSNQALAAAARSLEDGFRAIKG